MNSLSWLNRGLSTDDCRKASDMQKCLSNGGPMVENPAQQGTPGNQSKIPGTEQYSFTSLELEPYMLEAYLR